ncbi:MAG TPA: choice-of-anchor tandem repeat GloVer-containing protein [Terriglobales bacterium]|nr:choice-of-anchor tandem repeat GloVer-containing protein [Terriglobales bacterium]
MVFVLFLLILAADVGSYAQTYTVVYTFGLVNGENVIEPSGITVGQDGNLYGAGNGEYTGPAGPGDMVLEAVWFKVTPKGALTTLYNVGPCYGGTTNALTWGSDGNLYGAVGYGLSGSGPTSCGFGYVAKITPSGSATVLGTVDYPWGRPILGTDGNLYGTSCGKFYCDEGGVGYGTIYKITPPSTFTSLYEFDLTHGAAPDTLVEGSDGNFYGTTVVGGSTPDGGVIFRITPTGQLTVLYDFTQSFSLSNALIEGKDGDFYGTTFGGGNIFPAIKSCQVYGCGTIFKITPEGNYSLLYTFDVTHGGNPHSLAQGTDGNFYGTTYVGGTSTNCVGGCGVIFKITPVGDYSVLYNFDGTHGANPGDLVLDNDGNFYGTTLTGGSSPTCCGTIFRITPTGDFTNLYNFNGTDGADPQDPVLSSDGNLYGATWEGGPSNVGCTLGCGVLYSFAMFDFSLAASLFSPSSLGPGASSASTITVTPIDGFSAAVALSCSVQPTLSLGPQCSISPSSVTPLTTSTNGMAATLKVTTTGPSAGLHSGDRAGPSAAVWLSLAVLLGASVRFGSCRRQKQKLAAIVLVGTACVELLSGVACGGGGSNTNGTPAGAYTITVTGTSGLLQHSEKIKLTVQ